jgi:pimeloyl-ACP methyl ester carboxylesterase/bifunctional DNA-binding transcriptional regulator/antitoxin component of YhaV-PrlF toxin-antitoxin module
MKLYVLKITSLIFLASCSIAQEVKLPRKVLIGVGMAPLIQEIADKNKLKIGDGVSVTLVVPDSTAEALGIKVGDILTTINGTRIEAPAKMVEVAGKLVEGDEFIVELISSGKKKTLTGKAKGRPLESTEFSDVRHDAIEYELGRLRTIVHLPKGKKGKLPAVFYLQGYPCQTQEFNATSQSPVKKIIIDWLKAGYVVYRVERPNIGDSKTTKDCRDIDFDEELAGNRRAYQALLKYDFVDKDNVFLFGHSMGSYVAPYLAETYQPKGIIVYGSVLRSWFEYFVDIFRFQQVYFGNSRITAEANARNNLPALYAWLEEGKSPDEMRKDPQLKAILDAPGNPLNVSGDYFFGRHYNFWHTMNKKRLSNAWSKVKGKVLSVHGEFDVQAITDSDARDIANVVNETNPGNGEFLLIPKTEHIFLKAESYEQMARVISSGQLQDYIPDNYNPEVAKSTIEWMEKVRNS